MWNRSREVRLGLVMYGGVSLAVYENGVAQELFRSTKSAADKPTVYDLIKKLTDSDIVVDILSGTSAGGINGIMLAYALANGKDFSVSAGLWREKGDFLALLRDPGVDSESADASLLDSRGYFQRELEGAFRDIEKTQPGSPYESEIDLFVTGTNVYGRVFTEFDDKGHAIDIKDHHAVFMLSYRGDRKNEFASENIQALAKLSRITSCFPAAFEPVYVSGPEPDNRTDKDEAKADKTLRRWGSLKRDAYFLDGGVLDNKPFSYTIDAIFARLADRCVDRTLFYVEPDPEKFDKTFEVQRPNVMKAVLDSLIGIPGYESIAGDLQSISERNNKLARYKELTASLQNIARMAADFIDEKAPNDQACLDGEDSARVAMYRVSRFAQIRDRALLGILKEKGELQVLEDDKLLAAKVLVQSFAKQTSELATLTTRWPTGGTDPLTKFDVYFRLRRLFHLVYMIHSRLYEGDPPPEDQRVRLHDIWNRLNHQIKSLEMIRYAMEKAVDDSNISIIDLAGQKADESLAQAKWDAVQNVLQSLLDPPYALPDWGIPEGKLERDKRKQFMEDLKARLRSLASLSQGPLKKPKGNLLFETDKQERAILKNGQVAWLRDEYCRFAIIDSYLFPMERAASIEAKDVIRPVRISPIDAQRGYSDKPLSGKLCGNELGHFGGFMKRSWRANDIMWGRLDATCQLIECLLSPARILEVAGTAAASSVSPTEIAGIFPNTSPQDQALLQQEFENLNYFAQEHLAAAHKAGDEPTRFEQFLNHLIKAAQREIFEEEIPRVLECAIAQHIDWNQYPLSDMNESNPFNHRNQAWTRGVKNVDPSITRFARGQLARLNNEATPGQWTRYYEEGNYGVADETLTNGVPAPMLLEMGTRAALVLQNCLTGVVGNSRAEKVRSNSAYRFGITIPLKALYGFARFQRKAPEFARSFIAATTVLCIAALFVGLFWWRELISSSQGTNWKTFLVFIAAPSGVLLVYSYLLAHGKKAAIALIVTAAAALLLLTAVIVLAPSYPEVFAFSAWPRLTSTLRVIADHGTSALIGVLVGLFFSFAVRSFRRATRQAG